MKTKIVLPFFAIVLIVIAIACNKDDDEPTTPAADYIVTLQDSYTALPANVSVLFKVDDKQGVPVAGLEESDFVIYENNAVISEFEAARKIQNKPELFKYNILLLLDLSGSILGGEDESSLDTLKTAASVFINNVMPAPEDEEYGEILMAVMWFDGEENLHMLTNFSFDRDEHSNAVKGITKDISSDPSTNLNGAVVQGITILQAQVDEFIQGGIISAGSVVLFTDGTDQAGWNTDSEALNAVKYRQESTNVFTIGLGGEIDQNMLGNIGVSGFYYSADLPSLVETFNELALLIQDEAQSFYILEYCSPKRSGVHQLKIEVNIEGKVGALATSFDASGFSGGCTLE